MDPWKTDQFKIGINMAGAISAGAYTAGVLDFLIEALEEWQKAKDALKNYLDSPGSTGAAPDPVPLHDVSIDVFSGASAGGMCAAISAVMVQQPFTHIKTAQETGTTNTFYESWVNTIDIRKLLGTSDLAANKPLVSLLDSTIIDDIAKVALIPQTPTLRPYISSNLTLFLTLTNVRGVPYKLYPDPTPTVDEFIAFYGDKLQFQVTQGNASTFSGVAKPLPSGAPGAGAWPLLQQAAKATGAFPIFLAPRILTRDVSDYDTPPWLQLCEAGKPNQPKPAFDPSPGPTIDTLNVDGGVTDNDPFQLAHDFLALRNPKATDCRNPRESTKANAAVITVAPFPADDRFDPKFSPEKAAGIWQMLPRLVSVLISQSRFLGESLEVLTDGNAFSRFAIAPSDPDELNLPPLQCALLGAFGGFFERTFRAHDFLLGRRNCQKFLMSHFRLPAENPVIAAGLSRAGRLVDDVKKKWYLDPPNSDAQPQQKDWIPVIPLCGAATVEVPRPPRQTISSKSLSEIVDLVVQRLKAISPYLFKDAPAGGILEKAVNFILSWPVSLFAKNQLKKALADGLCPSVEGQKPEDCKNSH